MDLKKLVLANQKIIEFVNEWPGNSQPFHIKKNLLLTPYVGTLDVATARFNSILLRLSEHPLMIEHFRTDVASCQSIIQKFYRNTIRLQTWPHFMRKILQWRLHRIGISSVPKIKSTYRKLLITIDGKN